MKIPNRNTLLNFLVAVPALILALFSGQAQSLDVVLCFNDPDIKGDSIIEEYAGCIDARSVELMVEGSMTPNCTVNAIYEIGKHSPAIALAVIQSTPLTNVEVVFVDVPEATKHYELLLEGFVARKVTMEGEDDSLTSERITMVPDDKAASPQITITYLPPDSGPSKETIVCSK